MSALPEAEKSFLIEFKGILNRLDYLDEKFNGSKDRPLGLSVSSQHHICGMNSFVSIIKSLNTGAGPYHCGFHECRTSEVMDRVERGLDDLGIVFVTEYSKGQMMQELRNRSIISITLPIRLPMYTYAETTLLLAAVKSTWKI